MTEILRASGGTKVFGAGDTEVRAVDGVDLSVSAGQLALIMGRSGSGKTPLLTTIAGPRPGPNPPRGQGPQPPPLLPQPRSVGRRKAARIYRPGPRERTASASC